VLVTVKLKTVLSPYDEGTSAEFPFPIAFSALTSFLVGLIAFVLETASQKYNKTSDAEVEGTVLTWDERLKMAIIGAMRGVEIACVNKALEFLTLSQRTMITSMNVLCVMAIASYFKLESLNFTKLVAATLLLTGGMMQGLATWNNYVGEHDSGMSMVGYALLILAMFFACSRDALSQHLLQGSGAETGGLKHASPLRLLWRMMPMTCSICLLLTPIFEISAFWNINLAVLQSALEVSITITIMLTSELCLVKLTSAVALNVASALHNIPVVLAGVFFLHDVVHPYAAIGFAFCLGGAILYALSDRQYVDEETEKRPGKDAANDEQELENLADTYGAEATA